MRFMSSRLSRISIVLAAVVAAALLGSAVGRGVGMPSTAIVRVRATGPGYVHLTAHIGRSVHGLAVSNRALRLRIGTRLTMTATPRASGMFGGWGGACARTAHRTTCTMLVRRPASVNAAFVAPSRVRSSIAIVRVRATGPGYVRLTARIGRSVRGMAVGNSVLRLRIGTRLTMTATPRASGMFGGWGGACAHTAHRTTCTIIVRRPASVNAGFVAPSQVRVLVATQTSIVCHPVTYTGSPQLPCSATVVGAGGFDQPVPVVAGPDSTDAGTVPVSANFGGSGNYGPSSASASFKISQAVPQLSGLPTKIAVVGDTFFPTVNAFGDLPATVASTTPSVCTVSSSGVLLVEAGTCTLVPHAGQNTSDVAGAGAPQSFNVVQTSSIVQLALSQDQNNLNVVDTPASSECNPYTAYWNDGSAIGCAPNTSIISTGWCADFAAWVWQKAGVPFTYGNGADDINAATVSFYNWGIANGTWHPIGSGYSPQPGDVAVYAWGTEPSTGHVGIYVSGPAARPTVVNGNWAPDYPAGNSGVYIESGQSTAGLQGGPLQGYVSP